jgi:hypothetical protein
MLETIGRLPLLEEVQLCQGLRLLQDFHRVTHLAALTRLQVGDRLLAHTCVWCASMYTCILQLCISLEEGCKRVA